MVSGSCLCGGVTFEVQGDFPPPSACHCGQCRKQSGHFWASSFVPDDKLSIIRDSSLGWYCASDLARRGFCNNCGSFLFWKHNEEATTSFSMGALSAPTGAKLGRHIFVADKGDYYDLTDGLPQSSQ